MSTSETDTTGQLAVPVLSDALEFHVHETFGRFPAYLDPMYMRIVSQAHHVDPDFYDEHLLAGALSPQHQDHMARWHPELCGSDGKPRRNDA